MKLPLREGFIPPPNSVIAFSQHYLCFLSISQGIVLEIICVSLIGVACVVIVTVGFCALKISSIY